MHLLSLQGDRTGRVSRPASSFCRFANPEPICCALKMATQGGDGICTHLILSTGEVSSPFVSLTQCHVPRCIWGSQPLWRSLGLAADTGEQTRDRDTRTFILMRVRPGFPESMSTGPQFTLRWGSRSWHGSPTLLCVGRGRKQLLGWTSDKVLGCRPALPNSALTNQLPWPPTGSKLPAGSICKGGRGPSFSS